ncbi:MAG TPA: hypothetical protein VE268_11805, partial [Herpetosiphonaceae bacterium]|nr:hypothetical protein [Herpetosiphonaceae bacterium]
EAVAEAAVVTAPDPIRLAVPKAYVMLAAGWEPTAATAKTLLRFGRERMPVYSRIRRLEFAPCASASNAFTSARRRRASSSARTISRI